MRRSLNPAAASPQTLPAPGMPAQPCLAMWMLRALLFSTETPAREEGRTESHSVAPAEPQRSALPPRAGWRPGFVTSGNSQPFQAQQQAGNSFPRLQLQLCQVVSVPQGRARASLQPPNPRGEPSSAASRPLGSPGSPPLLLQNLLIVEAAPAFPSRAVNRGLVAGAALQGLGKPSEQQERGCSAPVVHRLICTAGWQSATSHKPPLIPQEQPALGPAAAPPALPVIS